MRLFLFDVFCIIKITDYLCNRRNSYGRNKKKKT